MGVLPLVYKNGETAAKLGPMGDGTLDVAIDDGVKPRQDIKVTAPRPNGEKIEYSTTCRIDTPVEVDYYHNGGILHTVLRKMQQSRG